MPSIINSDDGVVSGTSGLKTTGGNDGITTFQQNGTERMRITATGNVGIGNTAESVNDQVGAVRPLLVSKSDTSTTIAGSQANIVIGNADTTTNNTSQLSFAAITGANTTYFASAAINCVFGARTNGQYPTGQLVFSTSTSLNTAPTEKMRITSAGNLQFNSGYGSVATAYGCRAWVKFNSSGTVSGSGNISSVTKTGTGTWTLNFSTAMPDANYSVVGSSQNQFFFSSDIGSYATGSAGVRVFLDNGVLSDNNVTAAVFR